MLLGCRPGQWRGRWRDPDAGAATAGAVIDTSCTGSLVHLAGNLRDANHYTGETCDQIVKPLAIFRID